MKFPTISAPNITGTGLLTAADRGVFGAYLLSVGVVYVLDMIFFGSIGLAISWQMCVVFVGVGLVFRTGAVATGIYLQKLRGQADHRGARATMRAIWWACILACLLSAINFFAAGHAAKQDAPALAQQEKTVEVKDGRIAALEAQIAKERADRDAAIAEARLSIEAIQDEVDGMSAADNESVQELQDDISGYRESAAPVIREKEDRINAILAEKGDDEVQLAGDRSQAATWEVFVWLGDHFYGDEEIWSNSGLFYLAILIEAMAAFGLGAYADLREPYARMLARARIDQELEALRHEAELTEARTDLVILGNRLKRESAAAVRQQVLDDPEGEAAVTAVGTLVSLSKRPEARPAAPEGETGPSPDQPPDPPPDPPSGPPANPRDDWGPNQWNGLKGWEIRAHLEAAREKLKWPIPPEIRSRTHRKTEEPAE